MASASGSSLDGAPLLQAKFDEKKTGAHSVWRTMEVFACKFSPRSILARLKPSFLDRNANPAKVHPTSFLDGVRGYAAFIIFIYHFIHLFHEHFMYGYGSQDTRFGENYRLYQLPIIRLLYSGEPMVSMFWVLSGVSLSLKPIRLARSQNWDQFFGTMFSSIFRRGLRLYLPVFTVQVFVLLAVCFGMYNPAAELHKHWPYGPGVNEQPPKVLSTNTEQIQDWFKSIWKLLNPFSSKPYFPVYDGHLWTIQLELRCSMILFVVLVGWSKLRSRVRMMLNAALFAYCMWEAELDLALFIAGIGLAEFLVIGDENTKQLPTTAEDPPKQSTRTNAFWWTVLFIGLHLSSCPPHGADTSIGFATLMRVFKPVFEKTQLVLVRMGAAIFLFALCGCEDLRKPFQTPLAVYMGKISFSVYILHGPVYHLFGTSLVGVFWSVTGKDTPFTHEFGIIASFIITGATIIWLADIVARLVDQPSVRFGRTLQSKWSLSPANSIARFACWFGQPISLRRSPPWHRRR